MRFIGNNMCSWYTVSSLIEGGLINYRNGSWAKQLLSN